MLICNIQILYITDSGTEAVGCGQGAPSWHSANKAVRSVSELRDTQHDGNVGECIRGALNMSFDTVSGICVERKNFNCFGGEHCCVD